MYSYHILLMFAILFLLYVHIWSNSGLLILLIGISSGTLDEFLWNSCGILEEFLRNSWGIPEIFWNNSGWKSSWLCLLCNCTLLAFEASMSFFIEAIFSWNFRDLNFRLRIQICRVVYICVGFRLLVHLTHVLYQDKMTIIFT